MIDIIDKIVVTEDGRIFIADDSITKLRSFGSFKITPTLKETIIRYCVRHNINVEDIVFHERKEKTLSNRKLFTITTEVEYEDKTEVTQCINHQGYLVCQINKKTIKTHRLVAYYFNRISNYKEMQVNHIDGNKLNNHKDNLEWCTAKENITHSWNLGLSSRNLEVNAKARETMISRKTVDVLLDDSYQGQIPNMKLFLKTRELDWNDYAFIATGINKSGHKLGYLKKK